MAAWSMSRRLVLVLTAGLGVLWLAGVSFAALAIRHEIEEVFDSGMQEIAQRLLPLVRANLDLSDEKSHDIEGPGEDGSAGDGHEEYILYQVRDRSGRVLLRSHDAPETPFPVPLRPGFVTHQGTRYFTEVSGDGSTILQVAELPEEREEAVLYLWLGLLIPLMVLLPLAAIAVREIVRRTTRPLIDVQQAIRSRGGANLDPIGSAGLPVELAPIVADMNHMLGRLKAAFEAERSFSANAAHELRNPIAAAKAQVELLAASAPAEPDRQRARNVASALDALGRKIEKLLQLARAEAGVGFAHEETDLAAIVGMIVAEYASKPRAQGRVRLGGGEKRPLLVLADPDALGIAVQNLIDNALHHGNPAKTVDVTVGPGPVVSVANAGPVLPASVLAGVKSRFVRGQVDGHDGTGLGLFIADTIARQCGGDLELYSPARGRVDGFEAVVRLAPVPGGPQRSGPAVL